MHKCVRCPWRPWQMELGGRSSDGMTYMGRKEMPGDVCTWPECPGPLCSALYLPFSLTGSLILCVSLFGQAGRGLLRAEMRPDFHAACKAWHLFRESAGTTQLKLLPLSDGGV